MLSELSEGNEERSLAEVCGPGTVDKMIRETMTMCWMSLPQSKRSIDILEVEMQRLLSRALENWREDMRIRGQ